MKDLLQRVGGDELTVEVELALVEPKSSHLCCIRLQRALWNDVQVEGMTSTHCRQLDVRTLTCSQRRHYVSQTSILLHQQPESGVNLWLEAARLVTDG